jgi:uncharacterized protein
MKKAVLVLLICSASFLSSYSQTKPELIKELFKVMHQDSVIDKTFSAMIPAMLKQVQSEAKDSLAKARSQETIKATMPIMRDIAKRMMDEDMVVLYDKYFTESEIKDFIAFYKTPSGQKLVKTQPEIQKELMPIMFQKYIPEIQKAIKAKTEEMKANEKKAQ